MTAAALAPDRGAVLSPDGAYRYHLWRRVGPGDARVLFVMLNPSTADATLDDPTIRRCIGFARRIEVGWLDVVNLYAYRTTDPDELRSAPDPVGPDNNATIRRIAAHPENYFVIFAWGAWPGPNPDRPREVDRLFERYPLCLGKTKSGAPRHPLYLRADALLETWP